MVPALICGRLAVGILVAANHRLPGISPHWRSSQVVTSFGLTLEPDPYRNRSLIRYGDHELVVYTQDLQCLVLKQVA
jgi:hypothetical protein